MPFYTFPGWLMCHLKSLWKPRCFNRKLNLPNRWCWSNFLSTRNNLFLINLNLKLKLRTIWQLKLHSNMLSKLLIQHSNLFNQFLNRKLTQHFNLFNQLLSRQLTQHPNLLSQFLSRQLTCLAMVKHVQMYSNVSHKWSNEGRKIQLSICFPILKKKRRRLHKWAPSASVEDGSNP